MPQTSVNDITAIAYEHFAPYVRGKLARLGVRDADLPDLCHEVFLIVHDKGDMVPDVDRVDLWLREICRRVVAGYRRRFGNKLEILGRDLDTRSRPPPQRRSGRGRRNGAPRAARARPQGAQSPGRRIARSAGAARRRRVAADRARAPGRPRSQDRAQAAADRAASRLAPGLSGRARGAAGVCRARRASRRRSRRSCRFRRRRGGRTAAPPTSWTSFT